MLQKLCEELLRLEVTLFVLVRVVILAYRIRGRLIGWQEQSAFLAFVVAFTVEAGALWVRVRRAT